MIKYYLVSQALRATLCVKYWSRHTHRAKKLQLPIPQKMMPAWVLKQTQRVCLSKASRNPYILLNSRFFNIAISFHFLFYACCCCKSHVISNRSLLSNALEKLLPYAREALSDCAWLIQWKAIYLQIVYIGWLNRSPGWSSNSSQSP